MRIHALDLELSESELQELARRASGGRFAIESLRLREGHVELSGQVKLKIPMVGERALAARTLWGVSGEGRRLSFALRELTAVGTLPGLKALVVSHLAKHPALAEFARAEGESLHLDAGRLLGRFGLAGEPRIEAVRCSPAGLRVKLGGTVHRTGAGG